MISCFDCKINITRDSVDDCILLPMEVFFVDREGVEFILKNVLESRSRSRWEHIEGQIVDVLVYHIQELFDFVGLLQVLIVEFYALVTEHPMVLTVLIQAHG